MHLPARLHQALREGLVGLLATIGADGWPHLAFTWAASTDPSRVRAAADWPGTSLSNVERAPQAAVQFIGPGDLLYLVKGKALVGGRHTVSRHLRIAVVDIAVEQVKDQSWPFVHVRPLEYAWTRPEMIEAEQAVLRLLRGDGSEPGSAPPHGVR